MNLTKKLFPISINIFQVTNSQCKLISIVPQRFASFNIKPKLPTNPPQSILKSVQQLVNNSRTISFSIKNALPESLTTLQIKKRPVKKKRSEEPAGDIKGYFNVIAYATAEEYDLDRLRSSLIREDLYELKKLPTIAATETATDSSQDDDFLYVSAKIRFGDEPREIFFFREGSVVLWNCPELECSNVLTHLKPFEIDSYSRALVQEESDCMAYNYDPKKAHLSNGNFYLSQSDETPLEKYTFSNALSTSVKLGIWEATLDRYVDSMAYVTEDLKHGTKIKMSRAEVLRKTGELFALRHLINLSSDLLDTPDFYWDREQLENLYSATCAYFSVQRRTKVISAKIEILI